jgi:hypothetical protein
VVGVVVERAGVAVAATSVLPQGARLRQAPAVLLTAHISSLRGITMWLHCSADRFRVSGTMERRLCQLRECWACADLLERDVASQCERQRCKRDKVRMRSSPCAESAVKCICALGSTAFWQSVLTTRSHALLKYLLKAEARVELGSTQCSPCEERLGAR